MSSGCSAMAMADFMVRSYGAEGWPTDRKKRRVSAGPLADGRVPEARKKLAGGEAQRNHRNNRSEELCAPAGRERRETAPARLGTATLHKWQTDQPGCDPAGARRRGGRETEDPSRRRMVSACFPASRAPPGRTVG